jgi:hypothetical protein
MGARKKSMPVTGALADQIAKVKDAALIAGLREVGHGYGVAWAQLVLDRGANLILTVDVIQTLLLTFTPNVEEMAAALRKADSTEPAILALRDAAADGARRSLEKAGDEWLPLANALHGLLSRNSLEIN